MSTEHFLTPKQQQLLAFIQGYQQAHGFAPTQQEIAKQFGFRSLGTVQNYLVRLERQGLLKKSWNARRSLQPQPLSAAKSASLSGSLKKTLALSSHSFFSLPLLGRVAAGLPIEAVESKEHVDIPAHMLRSAKGTLREVGDHFVLRVVGDSMIDDGILDGDIVVLRKTPIAENGQTVVALIQNEATIKRFYKKAGRIELHAANAKYAPIIISEEDEKSFSIAGVLSGVLRTY
ncbi:MAG TPA: transcriptional repressor LexA [Oligoflexia bacterium]|nr:transcriptional repressor LexA [Oligoflexia bacterium]